MALINCPECNKEISDKVKSCPHCGYPLVEEQEVKTLNTPQQVEVTAVKLGTKSYKKPIIIGLIILLLGVAAFLGISYINEQKAEKAYQEAFNTYIDNIFLFQITSLSGAADAESYTGLVANVWRNAIYEERDSATDKYTRPNGYFVDDFNTALYNLQTASSSKSTVSEIEENQDDVQELMKDLQNPPAGLERCYDTITELYSAYKGLTDLAVNPTGSLTSFTDSRREKIDAYLNLNDQLNSQIPEKFETQTP